MPLIATWNVNSIRARLPVAIDWLKTFQPDIVLLQEIKTQKETFPFEEIEDLGYNIALVGQKTYNGVAILAKRPIEDVLDHLPGNEDDSSARYIEAVVDNVRVASIYVPNGKDIDTDAYHYKLQFLDRLCAHAKTLLTYGEAFILGGDYNIAPKDEDVYDPILWKDRIHCSVKERESLRKIQNLGLTDVTRALHPISSPSGKDLYSWWNYRTRAWQSNAGLRIDLLLASPQALDRLEASGIDTNPRDAPKASDHTPVWCRLV
ncbi:MAG: exodeoxyribonuclease III [Alphaproteobacteria bacterium]|nr:exodeoxyribonuclease III [Alphaproteobacteria bacterium]